MFLRARSATPSCGTRAPASLWAGGPHQDSLPVGGSPSTGTAQPAAPGDAGPLLPPLSGGGWPSLRSLSMDLDQPPSDGGEAMPQQPYCVQQVERASNGFGKPPCSQAPGASSTQRYAFDMSGPMALLPGKYLGSGSSFFDRAFHGGSLGAAPLADAAFRNGLSGPSDPAFEELLNGASPREQWLFGGIAPVGSCSALPRLSEDACPTAADLSASLPDGSDVARRLRGRRMRSASVPTSSRLGGEARAARQQVAVAAGDIRASSACHVDPLRVRCCSPLTEVWPPYCTVAQKLSILLCIPLLNTVLMSVPHVFTTRGRYVYTQRSMSCRNPHPDCCVWCRVATAHMAGKFSLRCQAAGSGVSGPSGCTSDVGRTDGRAHREGQRFLALSGRRPESG